MAKSKKFPLILFGILLISLFFRFYNFQNFQMWTGDDEIITATIRHIIWDKSPSLLIPNSTLGFGMGPIYFWAISIFYFLTSFNVVLVQAVASLIGVATTYMVYKTGKELHSEKLGLVASFLYASSFLLSIFDRRLWPLTLGPFLSALTLFTLLKVKKKDYRFIPLLALPIGFTFHSDLYLMVLVISIVVSWIMFRFPLKIKHTYMGIGILMIFALPFFLAEVKYNGAVSGPVIKSIARPVRGESLSSKSLYQNFGAIDFTNVLSRSLFTTPSNYMEQQWCHGHCNYPKPFFSPITQIVVIFLLGYSFILTVKKRNKELYIPWIIVGSFIFGMLFFNRIFKANFNQLYFLVILPIFLIIIAEALIQVGKKSKVLLLTALGFYFLVNIYTLTNSSLKYPLHQKINLVKASLVEIKDQEFALYASENGDIQGGGWTELYNLQKHPAVKSYWYAFSSWIYAAYSLYPGPIQDQDPETVVVIKKTGEDIKMIGQEKKQYTFKDIELTILSTKSPQPQAN